MNRSVLVSVLVAAVLLLLFSATGSAAVPIQEGQPKILDDACTVALDRCSARCDGLSDLQAAQMCQIGCYNAAATCSHDEPVTLSSEDYLASRGDSVIFTEAAACNYTSSCPSEYDSCADWSSWYDCGGPVCGPSTACPICGPSGCLAGGPAIKQPRERYRVCFNQQMEGCTEYQHTGQTLSCGC